MKDIMADPKVFHGRIGAAYDTLEKWSKSTKVLVKGEIAIAVDTAGEYHIKVGDGTKTFASLEYATLTSTEIKEIIKWHTFSCKNYFIRNRFSYIFNK